MSERAFALPDLGEGLEDGRIVAWLVDVGETVELNQPLVEIETAKATVEIPSPYAGLVVSLGASEGDDVSVGAVLVTFSVTDGVGGDGDSAGQSPPNPRSATAAPLPAFGVAATPAVRRLARDLGVDLSVLSTSVPGGRVTADDVRSAAGTETGTWDGEGEVIEISPARRAIAENLTRQASIPQVTTFRTVDCLELEAFRVELGLSPLPIAIAALCRTIHSHPMLNAKWTDAAILVRRAVNVGVATDTERGLVVPVVHDAGTLGIRALGAEIRRLAEAARSGRLTPDEVSEVSIGVSNTGSYGSEAGTPLLTPGCAVTVAIGVIGPRPLVVGGEVVARPACTLSLTFDHRVLDGATAGRALTDLVDTLQSADRLKDLPE
jgi:pyruvate dehydrogenase E2 component (dihydrolipoamide acetyltransferase)